MTYGLLDLPLYIIQNHDPLTGLVGLWKVWRWACFVFFRMLYSLGYWNSTGLFPKLRFIRTRSVMGNIYLPFSAPCWQRWTSLCHPETKEKLIGWMRSGVWAVTVPWSLAGSTRVSFHIRKESRFRAQNLIAWHTSSLACCACVCAVHSCTPCVCWPVNSDGPYVIFFLCSHDLLCFSVLVVPLRPESKVMSKGRKSCW